MRSALSEFKGNVFANALFSNIKNPSVVKRSCILIQFAANDHKFNSIKMVFQINCFDERLDRDAFVFDRQFIKNPKLIIDISLVFNRTTNDHIFISVAPILGDAVQKPVNALREKKKGAIAALLNHLPTFLPPRVSLFNQEIR